MYKYLHILKKTFIQDLTKAASFFGFYFSFQYFPSVPPVNLLEVLSNVVVIKGR